MTNEETYKWIYVHFAPCGDETKQDEAISIALKAIAKQIPKKPNMIQDKYNDNLWHLYCPSCENRIGMWSSRLKRGDMHNISNGSICPYCGRTIDCTGVE